MIFVHDYNNCFYKGAKEAVNQFVTESSGAVKTFPLSDAFGTLVIIK